MATPPGMAAPCPGASTASAEGPKLGPDGAGAFTAALIWVLIDFGILDVDSGDALQWVVLTAIAVVLGVGLSWSHVRRLLSGQSDVDDVDN